MKNTGLLTFLHVYSNYSFKCGVLQNTSVILKKPVIKFTKVIGCLVSL